MRSPSKRATCFTRVITRELTGGVLRKELQTLSGLANAEFVAALAQLEQSCMLIETRPDARTRQRLEKAGQKTNLVLAIPKDFSDIFAIIHREIYGSGGDRSKMQLIELLGTLDAEKRQLIDMFSTSPGTSVSFYSHTTSPASLAGKLVQANIINTLWERLDPNEQKICRRLCQADGKEEVSQVQRTLHLSRSQMAHYANQLENYGLAFTTFSGQEFILFIGCGTFKVLRKLIGELDEHERQVRNLVTTASVEWKKDLPIIHEAPGTLLFDIPIVVNAVYQTVVEPTQAGKVPKRVANKIFPLLHGSRPTYYEESDNYLDMVFSIAKTLGLIRERESLGQKNRYIPDANIDTWTQLEVHEQASRLLETWKKALDHSWSDIAGVNYHLDSYSYGYYMEASASRKGLLKYLAEHCEPGKWYALAPFLETIKTLQPQILRENSRYSAYGSTFRHKDVLSNWDHIDAEIITGMLSSTLHELGLTTLGFDQIRTKEIR